MHEFPRSVAVIIGIDEYSHGIRPLRTPVNDARALARLLAQKQGYHPICLLTNRDASRTGLARFFTQELPGQLGARDRLLFYFAGHGIALDDQDGSGPQGFLLPQDADAGDRSSFLPMAELHAWLLDLPCHHLLAILDCCFAGAFHWASTRDVAEFPEVLYQERYLGYIRDPAWQILTSAAYNERALDVVDGLAIGQREARTPNGHSPFAQALLEGLQGAADIAPAPDGDGVITASELAVYLRTRFEGEAGADGPRQTPELWPMAERHRRGQFIFLLPQREIDLPPAPDLTAANNPYRGLAPYREEHTDLFFGRDQVLDRLQAKVQEQALTVVLGPSGAGKSSLVQAGLLPRLRKEAERSWHILEPLRPGPSPLERLAQWTQSLAGGEISGAPGASSPLAQRVQAWAAAHPGDGLLLVVDQLEELFTLCHQPQDRESFLAQLLDALRAAPAQLRLVLTLRSDFEPQILGLDILAGEARSTWDRARFLVPLMTQDELRQVIERPATARVIYFQPPELVDELINEVVQMPGGLPLLSFTLSELYLRCFATPQEDRAITREAYQELGGVVGALQRRAGEERQGLAQVDPTLVGTLRRMMLRMVSLEGGELARRRVQEWELTYASPEENRRVARVRDALLGARLLVTGAEEGQGYLEPAHDALVTGWQELRRWIDQEQARPDDLRFQRRLTRATEEWMAADPEARSGLLWDDPARSGLLEQILAQDDPWMNAQEIQFVQASLAQTRRNRRIRRLAIAALTVIAAIATLAAFLAIQQRNTALVNESQLLTGLAQEQLTQDPVASINLLLEALPGPGNPRPYVPEAEAALYQAVQSSLERAYLGGVPQDGLEVALGKDAIALGGPQIRLVDTSLSPSSLVTLTEPGLAQAQDATRYRVRWLAADRLLAFNLAGQVQIWEAGELAARSHFSNGVEGVSPHPREPLLALFNSQEVWLWSYPDGPSRLLFATTSFLGGVAWSPDGEWLAVWDDSQLLLYPQGQEPAAHIYSDLDGVLSLAWAPDSQALAFRDYSGVHLASLEQAGWLPAPVQLDVTGAVPGAKVNRFAFAPSGDWLLLFLLDGRVLLWDRAAQMPLGMLEGHTGPVLTAAWSPEGFLATASTDGTVRLWDVTTGRSLATLVGHGARVTSLSWLGGGRLLSHGQDGSLRLWQLLDAAGRPLCQGQDQAGQPLCAAQGQRLVEMMAQPPLVSLAWPDEGTLVGVDGRGAAYRWSMDSGQQSVRPPGPEAGSRVLAAWDPTGARLVRHEPGGEGELWRWDGDWLQERTITGPISRTLWLDGQRLLVSGTKGSWIQAVDGRLLPLADAPGLVLAGAEQGNRLATGHGENQVRLWDVASGQALGGFSLVDGPEKGNVVGLVWNLAGTRLLVTADNGLTGTLSLHDPQSGRLVWPRALERPGLRSFLAPRFSPDGDRIATASDDILLLVDARSGQPIREERLDGLIQGVAWSPDGSRLLVWGQGGAILWDVARWKPVVGLAQGVVAAALRPDGLALATAGEDGSVTTRRLWPSFRALAETARACCLTRPLSPEQRARFLLPPAEGAALRQP